MKRGIRIRRLWVFDFDGTLSPLVPDRTVARLHPASLALLKDLVADPRDRVAVLSSRTLEDIVPRVPVPQVYLGGGCGLAWRIPGGGGPVHSIGEQILWPSEAVSIARFRFLQGANPLCRRR